MLKLSGTLLLIALACALTLAVIYKNTAPVIAEQQQILLERSLQTVLTADKYEKKEQAGNIFYEAVGENNKIIGWCIPLESRGYGGVMKLLVGIDINQRISGVKILEHKETPGLGSQISDAHKNEEESAFLKQFRGKKVEHIVMVKDDDQNIQAITGATISSKAVIDGVRKGIEEFMSNKEKK